MTDPSPAASGPLAGRTIVLGVSGSIAAYKAALLARLLLADGASVQVVMTASATRFVGTATFAGLTGKPVLSDMWNESAAGETHVALAKADLLVLCPATADLLARLAMGRADDLLTATALCTESSVLVAPAMHPSMWNNPATQRNVQRLDEQGRVHLVGPVEGPVASGERGMGRMAEPEVILEAVRGQLTSHDLEGQRIVVTAGPTVEDLDPVRFLSNRSSGKMGFALAARAAQRGAKVTLITGPVSLATPPGVRRVDVRAAIAMRGAVWQAMGPDLGNADALIMSAAVGDYRFSETFASKQKRSDSKLTLEMVPNPDIIQEIGQGRTSERPILVAFAVETNSDDELVRYASAKLDRKRVDLVVANRAEEAFARDRNRATLVSKGTTAPLPEMTKGELADRILDWLYQRLWDTAG